MTITTATISVSSFLAEAKAGRSVASFGICMGVSENQECLFRGPQSKDHSLLGFFTGAPIDRTYPT